MEIYCSLRRKTPDYQAFSQWKSSCGKAAGARAASPRAPRALRRRRDPCDTPTLDPTTDPSSDPSTASPRRVLPASSRRETRDARKHRAVRTAQLGPPRERKTRRAAASKRKPATRRPKRGSPRARAPPKRTRPIRGSRSATPRLRLRPRRPRHRDRLPQP